MEIERKYLVKIDELNKLDLDKYDYKIITQCYLSLETNVRLRKVDYIDHTKYALTIKSKGLIEREEVEIVITENEYNRLEPLSITTKIKKKRVLIPIKSNSKDFLVELDFFIEPTSLIMAEVEFSSIEEANDFENDLPVFFDREVTFDKKYHNINMVTLLK